MNLIIVESPTKARTLNKFLGKDYQVEATMGHIKDLPKSKLSIDIENDFKPNYEDMPKKSATIKLLKKASKGAAMVYIATDPDREGEAIAAHVRDILSDAKYKKENMKRISFHEITKEAVEDAISHPHEIDNNLVDAQISRRVLDRLVGYELSPLLWKKVRRGLSAGRVQSVAVRLIVEREKEIEKFKPEEYWQIFVDVNSKEKKKFTIELIKQEVHDAKTSKEIVDSLEKANYVVLNVRKREANKVPYPPFTTSTMTQGAAIQFGWSAKRTMRAAQNLYEEGLITYHRTDSVNIASVAIDKVRAFIKSEFGDQYVPAAPRLYKVQSKNAQEAHEAIRPTDPTLKDKEDLPSDNKKLYQLIWKRFVACQMSSSVFDQTTIDVEASKYLLRASGQIMKFDGWRKVMPLKLSADGETILPEVSKGDNLDLIKVNPIQKFTEPPARFNEASIIKTLEKLGIGRPSTYAPIISTIQLRQYVEKKEGRFYATPVGTTVTNFLEKNFPEVLNYEFTAEMENDLDEVANGKKVWQKEIKAFYKPFHKKLLVVTKDAQREKIEVEKTGEKCPECKEGDLVIRIGRFGKFISCSRFPDCKYTAKYIQKIGMICPKCGKGEVIMKKTSKGRQFFGCSLYPKCDYASWKNPKLEKDKEEGEDVTGNIDSASAN
jgi:DNA topoisomerase I